MAILDRGSLYGCFALHRLTAEGVIEVVRTDGGSVWAGGGWRGRRG